MNELVQLLLGLVGFVALGLAVIRFLHAVMSGDGSLDLDPFNEQSTASERREQRQEQARARLEWLRMREEYPGQYTED